MAVRAAADRGRSRAAVPVTVTMRVTTRCPAHVDGCRRGAWLLEQLVTRSLGAVFRDALMQLGPPCSCPTSEEATVPN